jgi:hypothetical protein
MLSILLFLASAHITVGQWVDVDYDYVITKQSYYQLFRRHQEAMTYIALCSLVCSDGDSFALGYKS